MLHNSLSLIYSNILGHKTLHQRFCIFNLTVVDFEKSNIFNYYFNTEFLFIVRYFQTRMHWKIPSDVELRRDVLKCFSYINIFVKMCSILCNKFSEVNALISYTTPCYLQLETQQGFFFLIQYNFKLTNIALLQLPCCVSDFCQGFL